MRYSENVHDLTTRIQAHKIFSRTTLESVIEKTIDFLPMEGTVLDLGCGTGNFYNLFSRNHRRYVGIDIAHDLLDAFAKKETGDKLLIESSMDNLPNFWENSFDAVYSIYSIYYTEDPTRLIEKIATMIRPGGRFVMIGPSQQDHAPEINRFCDHLQGEEASGNNFDGKKTRIPLFHDVIIPTTKEIFSHVETSEIDTSLDFPTSSDWAKYVSATPQVKESSNSSVDNLFKVAKKYSEEYHCLTVSKALTLVVSHK